MRAAAACSAFHGGRIDASSSHNTRNTTGGKNPRCPHSALKHNQTKLRPLENQNMPFGSPPLRLLPTWHMVGYCVTPQGNPYHSIDQSITFSINFSRIFKNQRLLFKKISLHPFSKFFSLLLTLIFFAPFQVPSLYIILSGLNLAKISKTLIRKRFP